MPNPMFSDVLQTLAGIAAFALCFLTPGYLVGSWSNVMGFRSRSLPEQALWSVALSGPVSSILTCLLGRIVPARPMVGLLLGMGAAAAVGFAVDLRQRKRQPFTREFCIVCGCMAAVTAYCVLATLGIRTAHSLYEGIASADLAIRVPLVEAAARGGLPPNNPLFAIDGHAPQMRYYYFWYVLCAQVVRLTPISARSAFVASSVWAASALVAVLFLTLKYLGRRSSVTTVFADKEQEETAPEASLQRICVTALALACVMGLDIIPAIAGLLFHRVRLMPDIEFWRPERMPSWLGAVVVAPHHMAGLAFGALGFLLLAITPEKKLQRLLHALLAAMCFAALAGTSTYIALCFVFAGLLLAALRLRLRQWDALALLAVCAAASAVLAWPFLHELTSNSGYTAAVHHAGAPAALIGNHYLKLVLRNWHFAYAICGYYARIWHLPFLYNPLRYIFPLMLLPALYVMELTFFCFVLWYQAKADFRSGEPMTEKAQMLWCLFGGIALPGLLLSSVPTQMMNDLGVHAGLALRLPLLVWAAPMFANALPRLRAKEKPTARGRWVLRLTLVALVLGIGGQIWQITMDRIYLPLTAHRLINPRLFRADFPLLQAREASALAARTTSVDAIVQSNPEGIYQPLFQLYTQRQMAAGDESCESAFGGDILRCRAEVIPPLHALYGGSGDPRRAWQEAPAPLPSQMTAAAFETTCRNMHLSELLASRADPAWWNVRSWVWTEPALYANDAVRVIPCPR